MTPEQRQALRTKLLAKLKAKSQPAVHVAWSCGGDYDDCQAAWCATHHSELFLCSVCNQAEAELEPNCPGPKSQASASVIPLEQQERALEALFDATPNNSTDDDWS